MPKTLEKKASANMLKKLTVLRGLTLANQNILQPSFTQKVTGITHWEELECLGFNPELSRVEAIVNIKQSNGYSGNLCSLGSPEFVRFFIDYHDGNGFEDLGISSFRAFDISEAPAGPQHPLSYMVSKTIDTSKHKKFCNQEVLATLRAVLSWNTIPSTNAKTKPLYGNVLDAEIVLKPFQFTFPIKPILVNPNLPVFNDFVDIQKKEMEVKMDVPTFLKQNIEKGISPGRAVSQLMALSAESNSETILTQLQDLDLNDIDINIDDLVLELGNKDFNVGFEEIESIGLNTAQDTLGAIINIKKPSGYSGNLCKKGSLEYVSFFADFNNNGVFEKYLGTSFVKVNDIASIPSDGLKYAVFLKSDFSKYLKKCTSPQVVRIRAILSWATPPDASNPEQSVVWGNRMDALVQLRPKKGNQTSIIYSVGNVSVDNISPTTNLAYPGNDSRKNNRPWGANIMIKGGIDNSGTPGTTKYRVEYSQNGIDFFPVTLKQTIRTISFSNPINPFQTHVLESPDGWFPYLANHNANNLVVIQNQVLANWPSHAFEGKYFLRVGFTKSDPIANPASINYSSVIKIQLDNRRFRVDNTPNNSLDLNFDIDMTIEGGVCKTYEQGAEMNGKVKVRDRYYGGYDLSIQPSSQIINTAGLINYAPGAILNNSSDSEFGPLSEDFMVDTSKLNKCGYTLRLRGYERAILNNDHRNPYGEKYIGFAVK